MSRRRGIGCCAVVFGCNNDNIDDDDSVGAVVTS